MLDGIRIVDPATVIMCPFASRTLAELVRGASGREAEVLCGRVVGQAMVVTMLEAPITFDLVGQLGASAFGLRRHAPALGDHTAGLPAGPCLPGFTRQGGDAS